MGRLSKKRIEEIVNSDSLNNKTALSSTEAMLYLGYGPTKFWNLVNSRAIVGRKDGTWRFERKDLDKYKKRMTVAS